MAWLFLLLTLIGAWLAYNVRRPLYAPVRTAAVSFFIGWLTGELALHHMVVQGAITLFFIAKGVLYTWQGKLGLLIVIASWVSLWRSYWASSSAEGAVESALMQGLGEGYRSQVHADWQAKFASAIDWRPIRRPFPMRHPEVERIRNITYTRAAGLNIKLDVYRHRSQPQNCPTLLQIHGGGWCIGSKNEQGLPLMLHMAARGWVCVSADYRLSPHATFPDHLIDLKRAIQWIREHGAEYGADPDFIVVTGGSAGGHLAALVALTANDPEYQPGFEQVDTRVRGCVPFYGVFDFTDRHQSFRNKGLHHLLETRVMKASLDEAPEAYEKASPIARVRADAPPFMVVHGDNDTLVPVGQAQQFVTALRAVSLAPVLYAEVPGAQHAFEIFHSLRTSHVIYGVERFLGWVYTQYLAEKRTASDSTQAA